VTIVGASARERGPAAARKPRSLIMSKGNKVRKKEVRKPKQDKKTVKK
jgi:hypothetical protein